MTLDLNTTEGARLYIRGWLEEDLIEIEHPDGINMPDFAVIRAARELFLNVDPRPSIGSNPH